MFKTKALAEKLAELMQIKIAAVLIFNQGKCSGESSGFETLGLNKRASKEIVEAFFGEIRGSLENGEQVKLSGFGNFDLRDKNERPGRNPKTGEDIPISARRVVTFRPGQKLKSRVAFVFEDNRPDFHPVALFDLEPGLDKRYLFGQKRHAGGCFPGQRLR